MSVIVAGRNKYPHLNQEKEPRCGIRNTYGGADSQDGAESTAHCNLHDPSDTARFTDNNIVGGEGTLIGEFPWMVSFRDNKTKETFCGGTLIDRQHILTAAHCFMENGIIIRDFFKVAVGWRNSTGTNKMTKEIHDNKDMMKFGTRIYSVDVRKGKNAKNLPLKKGELIIHDGFKKLDKNGCKKESGCSKSKCKKDTTGKIICDKGAGVLFKNDIAIVRLKNPIKFNNRADSTGAAATPTGTFVRPICLPRGELKNKNNKKNNKKKIPIEPRYVTKYPKSHTSEKGKKLIEADDATHIWITGYGKAEKADTSLEQYNRTKPISDNELLARSKYLRKAYIGAMTNEKCQNIINKNAEKEKITNFKIADKQICAKSLPQDNTIRDTCQGDSGGPLAFEVNLCSMGNRGDEEGWKRTPEAKKVRDKCIAKSHDKLMEAKQYQLLGITSWGVGCGGSAIPPVYTRVSEYIGWIKKKTKIDGKHNKNLQFTDESMYKN